jgi:hypothetical protein
MFLCAKIDALFWHVVLGDNQNDLIYTPILRPQTRIANKWRVSGETASAPFIRPKSLSKILPSGVTTVYEDGCARDVTGGIASQIDR